MEGLSKYCCFFLVWVDLVKVQLQLEEANNARIWFEKWKKEEELTKQKDEEKINKKLNQEHHENHLDSFFVIKNFVKSKWVEKLWTAAAAASYPNVRSVIFGTSIAKTWGLAHEF